MRKVYEELASTRLPDCPLTEAQQQAVLHGALGQIEREKHCISPRRKPWRLLWRMVAAAALLCLLCAGGVAAAGYLLRPEQVARQMDQNDLSALFAGPDAVEVNETQQANGYTVTLLGLTSGANATGYWSSRWEGSAPEPDRSYAVVAVRHTDGMPMGKLSDGGDITLTNSLVSPLLASSDCPLMEYNVFTMNGARSDLVSEGVRYILVETDSLEPFADRDPQLAVILDDEASISTLQKHYAQDPATGAITPDTAGTGSYLLFDLPIDPAKADPAKARQLQEQWFGTQTTVTEETASPAEAVTQALAAMTPEEIRAGGTLQDSETVTITEGTYGTGWYFGDGGFLAYPEGWNTETQSVVQFCTDQGQVVLLTRSAEDTLTVETWQIPVS